MTPLPSLPPVPEDFGSQDVVFVASAAAPERFVAECCGPAFESTIAVWCHEEVRMRKSLSQESVGPSEGRSSPEVLEKDTKSKGKKKQATTKLSEKELEEEHYVNLGIDHLGLSATDEDIRKAYKQRSMETHPDKTGGDDTMFKKVQLASEVLLNPLKRRAFDSSQPFDDDIPPAKVPADRFYRVFRAAFNANARWYDGPPGDVPDLGDDDTPLDEVEQFYSFWYSFRSWRDFSHEIGEDLHDLAEAEDRFERRWMERENAKQQEKAKKREKQRLLDLTERAYKNDPRLLARDRKKAEERQAKADARRREEAERQRIEQEKQERLAREEEERKAAAKDLKAALKRARQLFRKACAPVEGQPGWQGIAAISRPDLDWMLQKMELSGIEELRKEVDEAASAEPRDGVHPLAVLLYKRLEELEQQFKETRSGAPITSRETFWSVDDLLLLNTAVRAVAEDAEDRWEQVSARVAGRSAADCRERVERLESLSESAAAMLDKARAAAAEEQRREAERQARLKAEEEERLRQMEITRRKKQEEEERKKQAKKKEPSPERKRQQELTKFTDREKDRRKQAEALEAQQRHTLFQQYSVQHAKNLKELARRQEADEAERAKAIEKAVKKIQAKYPALLKQESDRRQQLLEKAEKEGGQLLEREAAARPAMSAPAPKKAAQKPAAKGGAKPAPKEAKQQQQQPKQQQQQQPKQQQQQQQPKQQQQQQPKPKPAPKKQEPTLTFVVNSQPQPPPQQQQQKQQPKPKPEGEDAGAWSKVPKASGGKKKK